MGNRSACSQVIDCLNTLRKIRKQILLLDKEVDKEFTRLLKKDETDNLYFMCVEEDEFIIDDFISKLDDVIRTLDKSKVGDLISLNEEWKNNQI